MSYLKRFLCILFILVLSCSLIFSAISTSAEGNPVELEYLDDYYHVSNGAYWIAGTGTATNATYPGGTLSFFKVYDGYKNNYVYTIKTQANFTNKSLPGYNTDLTNTLHPVIYAVNSMLISEDISYTSNDVQLFENSSFAESNGIRSYTYSYNNNRDVYTTYVFESSDPTFFDYYSVGFGFNWAPFQLSDTTSVVYSRYEITATEAINEQAFYQENLNALNDMKNTIEAGNEAQITAINENGEQTRASIDELKEQQASDAAQAHADAERAHQDAENAPQREKDYVEENKGDTDDISLPDIPIDSAKSFVSDLFSTLSSTTVQQSLVLPNSSVPFLDINLWDNGTALDFSTWLNQPMVSTLIAWFKGITAVLSIFAIIWGVYRLVMVALGRANPKGDDINE